MGQPQEPPDRRPARGGTFISSETGAIRYELVVVMPSGSRWTLLIRCFDNSDMEMSYRKGTPGGGA